MTSSCVFINYFGMANDTLWDTSAFVLPILIFSLVNRHIYQLCISKTLQMSISVVQSDNYMLARFLKWQQPCVFPLSHYLHGIMQWITNGHIPTNFTVHKISTRRVCGFSVSIFNWDLSLKTLKRWGGRWLLVELHIVAPSGIINDRHFAR